MDDDKREADLERLARRSKNLMDMGQDSGIISFFGDDYAERHNVHHLDIEDRLNEKFQEMFKLTPEQYEHSHSYREDCRLSDRANDNERER